MEKTDKGIIMMLVGTPVLCLEKWYFQDLTLFVWPFLSYDPVCLTGITGQDGVYLAELLLYKKDMRWMVLREESSKDLTPFSLTPFSFNPIKRVCKLTRWVSTNNVYFSTLNSIAYAVENQFRQWTHFSSILRKLCAIN
jgi:hypothetical protein